MKYALLLVPPGQTLSSLARLARSNAGLLENNIDVYVMSSRFNSDELNREKNLTKRTLSTERRHSYYTHIIPTDVIYGYHVGW